MGATNDQVEANRNLGRKFFAEQDRLRGGPSPETVTADYTAKIGSNPVMDRAGHEGFAKGFYAALPDARHEVERVIADADGMGVAVRFVIQGTHSGPFFGIPATGKKITVGANILMRIEGGKVRELVGVFDEAGMLRQMGVLPGG